MTHEITTAPIDVAERRNGIGGSDVGALAGLSPWKSALDLWLEKTGRREPEPDNKATKRGRLLEDVLARWYAEEHGVEVLPGALFIHPARPWQRGNVDRLCVARDAVLECKSVGRRQAFRWGEPGTDEIPEEHIAQTQWYLAIPQIAERFRVVDVPVLLAGDFELYRVERNEALGAALVEMAERFWIDHVKADKPPPVDGGDSAREWLAKQYPKESAPLLKANEVTQAWALRLRDARERLAAAETDKAEAENRLKDLIGSATGIEGDGWRITWKASKGKPTVDWKAIAAELAIPEAVIINHTRRTPVRVFRPTFPGLKEEE